MSLCCKSIKMEHVMNVVVKSVGRTIVNLANFSIMNVLAMVYHTILK